MARLCSWLHRGRQPVAGATPAQPSPPSFSGEDEESGCMALTFCLGGESATLSWDKHILGV